MFVKAATGSAKNIVPKRLIARSKRLGVEPSHLGVAQRVAHVLEPLGRRELSSALEHSLGDIDPDDASRCGLTPRLASRQTSSAADVQNLIATADPVGGAKVLVVSAQLDIVEIQSARRRHRARCYGANGSTDLLVVQVMLRFASSQTIGAISPGMNRSRPPVTRNSGAGPSTIWRRQTVTVSPTA